MAGGAGERADGGDEQLAAALRQLCIRQAVRVDELEALNQAKGEQLLKLHGRLEEALMVLQAGQRMYADQQRMLDAQQATIAELCSRQAATIAAGAERPGGEGAKDEQESEGGEAEDEDDEEVAAEMAELARRAEELQRQLEALTAAAARGGLAPPGPPAQTAPPALRAAGEEVPGAGAARAMQTAPRFLNQLQCLLAMKDDLESQLREEQGVRDAASGAAR
mmetsp:Transcript_59896/g.165763  ORF Transcript_59896/g.165763 Transcript_59896/m.165763 type:complete len:222 (-) Transcript_59896:64-729(-)|eukprot:CAMPEP_0179085280 /NCGR_PEP_ID=MMETSP0796-20121207/38612_1 /TAXON_ID=73915 /ORGANISM="Pyrodinium bahamense, Strain pbaha01" /LENGTH=221 /DNA_ID=CAMNT_0020782713 /DNA_START=22 /DNA_END=687 /DNA_ORIENTATION=+